MALTLGQMLSRLLLRRPARRSVRPGRGRTPTLQVLESRVVPAWLVRDVLAGTADTLVTGTVYEDANRNGVRDNGENGVSGWTVYLDLDQSGTLNRDALGDLEPSAVTNQDGDFTINHLIPGTFRLAEVLQTGWEATAPVFQDVTVVNNRTTRADFFNFSGGSIAGTVWNDLNANGVRDTDDSGAFTDPGLPGWTVFLDLNTNLALDAGEPATITDAEGIYSFSDLPPGDYEVTEIQPGGPGAWDVPEGYDIHQTAAVVARETVTQDFANFSLTDGSITGVVWNDQNADGVRATDSYGAFTEPGLEGWTVFLDTNLNGSLDDGELSTTTDAAGHYSFLSLPEGDYEVTEVLPVSWDVAPTFDSHQTVTVAVGEATAAADFANFTILNGGITGVVWNDLNRNGSRDTDLSGTYTDLGLAGWTVYLDLNGNGAADTGEPTALTDAAGAYSFADLQVGEYEVREVLPAGWEPTATFSDSYNVRVYSGSTSAAHEFANFNVATSVPGSIAGTVWNDLNGNGVRDQDTGGNFTDPGLGGWTVFADLNGNGVADAAEPSATSAADGRYTLVGVRPGTVIVRELVSVGWRPTAPPSGTNTLALRNAENLSGIDFGNEALKNSSLAGVVFADANSDGLRQAGENGLSGITVYLDLNTNGTLDAGEPQTATSTDLFFTPGVDESGSYSFTHLAAGGYTVRAVMPDLLSATPAAQRVRTVIVAGEENRTGVDFAARYRRNEIHGVSFNDANGNHQRDTGEAGVAGSTVFIDLDRDNVLDSGEPTTVTAGDGSYSFTDLDPGAYVVREVLGVGRELTYPTTTGGVLWPTGTSNPAVGNVTPTSITTVLANGQSHAQTVSITLPGSGQLTNLVDVFLLFDDTGSFVNNSPIVRGAFPTIISQLQSSLPGIDLGFGVGRFEEYSNFAWEYATGRPFVLNQPIVAASTTGYLTAIQAALNRTTPGYGGDQPETDIEALYQLATGVGFDGNNNGSVLDSGRAGLVSTQINPGASGDVPSFASFVPDSSGNVMAAAGSIGGGGFRAGALPVVLLATDTGFAYQPKGETSITGVGGLTLPLSALTGTSRPTTPFNSGAGIQQTVTALNALGALVIGLGTNAQANIDPRQGLESLSKLTGAINRSTATIANGTADPIAPGDPFYFQIASGFAGSVASGVVNAIQNAVTNIAVDFTVVASDPRVRIVNHTGVRSGVGAGQTATFDIEFVGDGVPHRFDLQFVRNGTNVVLGSIPVVIGTPIPGDGYEFEDLEDGELAEQEDFGSHESTTISTPTVTVTGGTFTFNAAAHAATATATGVGGVTVAGSFSFTYNGSASLPVNAGTYAVLAAFTSADPNYTNATGSGTLIISAAGVTIAVTGGTFTYDAAAHAATATATGVGGAIVVGTFNFTYNGSSSLPVNARTYAVLAAFTSADPNYADASGSGTVTITAATPTISVTGGTFTYDAMSHAATATATGVGGAIVVGSFSFTYDGSSSLPVNAGTYAVLAAFTSTDPNYADATGSGTVLIDRATPVFSNLSAPVVIEGTSSATLTGHLAAGPTIPVGGTVTATLGTETRSATVNATGDFTLTFTTGSLAPAVYPVTLTYAGDGANFNASANGSSTVTVAPGIRVTGVAVAATAGAPVTATVATITNPLGAASAYTATITWGDGSTSVGVVTGSGATLTVTGTDTFADPGTASIQVVVQDNLGLGLSGTGTSTATVTSLGRAADKSREAEFWKKATGQALIRSFNGGSTHTELSTWLAGNFANLYGASSGANNLTGKNNAEVALYFKQLWQSGGDGAYAQVLATALNVYAKTASLGGAQAAAYGFTVTATGLGAQSFNVRSYGAAVGVPNNTTLNVFQMLRGVNALAVGGVFYNGDLALLAKAKKLFDELNSI